MTKETESKVNEVVEATASANVDVWEKIEDFFDKYKKQVLIGVVVIIGGAALWGGYKYLDNQSNEEAAEAAWAATLYWESDSLDKAMNGDKEGHMGLVRIVDEYGSTKAGNLAKFQLGYAYLSKGKYEEAIDMLKSFDGNGDYLVQARAYCLIGDAYLELNQVDDAIKYYEKASNEKPNEQFTPRYLEKLGMANEEKKDYEAAVKAYDKVLKEYPTSTEAYEVKKSKARAEQLAAKN